MTGVCPRATFDARAAGPDPSAWDPLVTDLPDLLLPEHGEAVVVVAAHPDDETLGAGGLLATLAARGNPVTVVVATDGEASHPDSPTHTRQTLATVRRRELYGAVAALAPHARVVLLGLPDGGVADHEDALADALDEVVTGTDAPATLVVTPWTADRHPDHEACARVGARTATRHRTAHWQYPVWAWHWDDPDDGVLRRAPLRVLHLDDDVRAAKAAALACHVSQHAPLSDARGDEALLPSTLLTRAARPHEVFVAPPTRGGTPVDYFRDLYADSADPWGLDTRFYERRKRAALLAAMTRPRYRRAFEPGCAGGLLTAELARRCDEVVAWDVVPSAVAAARATVAAHPTGDGRVLVEEGQIPDQWPDGPFDLVVLSEVGYYCDDLGALAAKVEGSLAPDGELVACHWRHPAAMHVHTAGAVHAALGVRLHLVVSHVEDDFLLQVWTRTGDSVARAEGIVG